MTDKARALQIVAEAISRQFHVAADQITGETVALDVPGWDSFSNGLLLMALEDIVGSQLPFDDMTSAENVDQMADIVARYI